MPTKQKQEPNNLHLAKMTMDEVGADIEEHGHVAVTDENRTQDPFTAKGSLANALDEALDYSNPNFDPTDANKPQQESSQEVKPDDTTMDKAPEMPVKDSLAEVLDSVVAMDAETEVPGESDDETHQKWEQKEIDKRVPKVPTALGGDEDKPDENGLVYLTYVISVDPTEYQSINYKPKNNGVDIKNAASMKKRKGKAPKGAMPKGSSGETIEEVAEVEVESDDEPTAKEEAQAAKVANKEEQADLNKDREAADEAVVLDYASSIDGSSFICYDLARGIDFSKVAMDINPRRAPTRESCQTTFSQCRAENPLYCRFHGPKLLEADLKTQIRNRLQRQGIRADGLVVSVERDSNRINQAGNALTFKVTVGCTPQQKNQVQGQLDAMFNRDYRTPNSVPGIKLVSNPRTSGQGDTRTMTADLEMDLLSADRPPRRGAEERAAALNMEVNEPQAPAPANNEGGEQGQPSQEPAPPPEEQQPQQPPAAQGEQTGRPTEREINHAAIAISNANIDVLDDAYAGLTGILNGTVQGFGATSAEDMTRQMGESYIEALNNDEEDHSNVIRALQSALANLPQPQAQPQQAQQPSQNNEPEAPQEEQTLAEDNPLPLNDALRAAAIEHVDRDILEGRREESNRDRDINSWTSTFQDLLNPNAHYWSTLPDGVDPETERRGEAQHWADTLRGWQQAGGHNRFSRLIEALRDAANVAPNRNTEAIDPQPVREEPQPAVAPEGGQRPANLNVRQPSAREQRQNEEGRRANLNANANGGGNGDNIEHLEGGVKARFSDSEIAAITREKNRAIAEGNANPGNAELNSYAHTLSNMLGSANSRYGRRRGALRGITDGITKAELLEKAQQRLERVADAENTARYDGAVRALQKIAELSGLGQLEIDGTRVGLANHPQQQPAEATNPPLGVTNEEIVHAAIELAEGENEMYGLGREEATNSIVQVLTGAGYDDEDGEQRRQDDARTIVENISRDGNERIYDRLVSIANSGAIENANEAPAAEPPPQENPPQPTDEEIQRAAQRIATHTNYPVDAVASALRERLSGTTPIGRDEQRAISMLSSDDPVRQALERRLAEQNRRETENARAIEEDAPIDEDIDTNLSEEEARRQVTHNSRTATREEVEAARRANAQWWDGQGFGRIGGNAIHSADSAIVAANTTGLSREVKNADAAVQRAAMPGCGRFRRGTVTGHLVFADSQTQSHGCDCWKTVAAALLRLRGFKVKARREDEASPVFAGTNAEEGQQKLTFIESQSQMAKNYERVNGKTRAETIANLKRIAEGSDGSDGHPPSLPYPDGTFISTWNGGHCTGAVLCKGKFMKINPYYSASEDVSMQSAEMIAISTFSGSGTDYTDRMLRYVRSYKEAKANARRRGERYQLPDHSEQKVIVGHFLTKQREMRHSNPNVTDEEVCTACGNDSTWLELNGSYVIRPDEALIPALFGLAKPSRN